MIDIGCGTGLNFPLLEAAIGPAGRIVGVDLTDAMLARAQRADRDKRLEQYQPRASRRGRVRVPEPGSTRSSPRTRTSLLPEPSQVVAHGAAALSAGGRLVVLDLKIPDNTPRWLTQLGIATAGRSGALDEWIVRRPWEAIRAAMQEELADPSWTELCFGTAYLAAGSRAPRTTDR